MQINVPSIKNVQNVFRNHVGDSIDMSKVYKSLDRIFSFWILFFHRLDNAVPILSVNPSRRMIETLSTFQHLHDLKLGNVENRLQVFVEFFGVLFGDIPVTIIGVGANLITQFFTQEVASVSGR